jgi:hypothetical protein
VLTALALPNACSFVVAVLHHLLICHALPLLLNLFTTYSKACCCAACRNRPCMYLLQLDTGRTLDTDAAHISQAEAAGSTQGQPTGAL